MAYVEGQADNHRDLLCKLIDHLIDEGYTVLRGQRNKNVTKYIDDSAYYSDKNPLSYDVSIAMGWEDYDALHSLHLNSWLDYKTNMNVGSHIGFQYNSDVAVSRYDVVARAWGAGENFTPRQPAEWYIEYSTDGTVWNEADHQTDQTWTSGEKKTFAVDQVVPKSAPYWRMRLIANNGDATYVEVGRLRFFDDAGTELSNKYSPEFILQSTGVGGADKIFFYFSFAENKISDYYSLIIGSFFGYVEDKAIDEQIKSKVTYCTGWNQDIPYQLQITKRHFHMCYKISTVSSHMFMGLYLPYATPSQYSYPFILSGNILNAEYRWSTVNSAYHRNLQAPGHSCFVFLPNSSWGSVRNYYYNTGTSSQTDYLITLSVSLAHIIPTHKGCLNGSPGVCDDGTYPLIPYIIFTPGLSGGKQVLGEVPGIYWCSGTGNAFENEINYMGKDYFVFQNQYRTGWRDYAVITKE